MSTSIYPLLGGDRDETKVWYPLDLGMRMGMHFFMGMSVGLWNPSPFCPIVISRCKKHANGRLAHRGRHHVNHPTPDYACESRKIKGRARTIRV